jgi:ADP-sugar diphosphatase
MFTPQQVYSLQNFGQSPTSTMFTLFRLTAARLLSYMDSKDILETFNLEGFGLPVPVRHPKGITKEQIQDHDGFKTWTNTLRYSLRQQKHRDHPFYESRYELKEIEIQSYDMVGERLLFLKLFAKVQNSVNDSLPGIVFLRGGAVAVLIILRPFDSLDERYVVMTEQPRIPVGSLSFMEIPAGMKNPKDRSISIAAVRDLKDKVGLDPRYEDFIDMTEMALRDHQSDESLENAMYPSPGGCDEFISILLWEKEMDRMLIDSLRGQLSEEGSNADKGRVRLFNYEKLLQVGARDGKTWAAWSLYEYLKRTGQIK